MKKFFLMLLLLIIGGMILALPAKAVSPPTQENGSCKYTITNGDWLSKLAGQYLGDPRDYPAITYYTNEMAFNDSSFDTILNSDVITEGQKICLPSLEETTTYFKQLQAIANNQNNTFGVATSLEAIDPFTDTNRTADDFVEPLLFDTLITLNEDALQEIFKKGDAKAAVEGSAQPVLAESWELAGDNPTIVTLNLRKDVTYHNGEPFDADHLTSFWNQLLFPSQDFGCPTATSLDIYTIQLTCHNLDTAEIIFGLSQIWIVHPDYFLNKEKALFGTGPWQVNYSGQKSGEPVTLIENPAYWGVATADSAEWNFQFITDPADPGLTDLDKLAGIVNFDPSLIGIGATGIGDTLIIHIPGDWEYMRGSGSAPPGSRIDRQPYHPPNINPNPDPTTECNQVRRAGCESRAKPMWPGNKQPERASWSRGRPKRG